MYVQAFRGSMSSIATEHVPRRKSIGPRRKSIGPLRKSNRPVRESIRVAFVCWVLTQIPAVTHAQSSILDSGIGGSISATWGVESLYHSDQILRGAASCATSSCHGGPKAGVASPTAPRSSEYPLWLERDPHANAWRTLSSENSTQMMKKLGILRDGKISNPDAYKNCLACHSTDRSLLPDGMTPRIAEGVGCESCHGPANRWYDAHFQGAASQQLAKQDLGLADLKPLVPRAKACSLCHVGAKDRDMNHDMIAAGHPALYFDMSVYYEAYPKHWRDADPHDPNFRSRLWLAGQIAAADSELELIESRAKGALPVSVWPELSNYECTSCHVTLNGIPKPTSQLDRRILASGTAPVRDWNLVGLDMLSVFPRSVDFSTVTHSNRISALLQKPLSNSSQIATQSQGIRQEIGQVALGNANPHLEFWTRNDQLKVASRRLDSVGSTGSWEQAAAAYISAWATIAVPPNKELNDTMRTLRRGLLFPVDSQSPKFPRPADAPSPPNLEQWNQALRQATTELLKK